MSHPLLEPLPYAEWKPALVTVHLWCQIVGKIRLGHVPPRTHWWNVTLHPSARGLTTGRMRRRDTFFEIEFDFVDHRLVVRANTAHEPATIALRDGLSVAAFRTALFDALRGFGIDAEIIDTPYGMGLDVPFSLDTEHAAYDRVAVRRWWQALLWSADVFDEYGAEFLGKESPAHLFWHGFDLAFARYSGRPAPAPPPADVVQREAYSHEVIAVGFWPGDDTTPEATYYTYTAPEPPSLTTMPLSPAGAAWRPSGSGHLGALPYEAVRTAADPRATLLAFVRSGFDAGARAASWETGGLLRTSSVPGYRADRA